MIEDEFIKVMNCLEFLIGEVAANMNIFILIFVSEITVNSPRPFTYHRPGTMPSEWSFFNLPVGVLFKKYQPWKMKIIQTLDRVCIQFFFLYELISQLTRFR